jgi:hypothetical protein
MCTPHWAVYIVRWVRASVVKAPCRVSVGNSAVSRVILLTMVIRSVYTAPLGARVNAGVVPLKAFRTLYYLWLVYY